MNHRFQGALIGGAIVATGVLLVSTKAPENQDLPVRQIRCALVTWAKEPVALEKGERILAHVSHANNGGTGGYLVLIGKE